MGGGGVEASCSWTSEGDWNLSSTTSGGGDEEGSPVEGCECGPERTGKRPEPGVCM